MLVFVYGTLQRGGSNHHFLRHSRFVSAWTTPARFRLYDLGAYPGVVMPGATAIQGELFDVVPRTLVQLDRLEEVPRVYRRYSLPTPYGHAIMYVLQRFPRGASECHGGRWSVVNH